MYVVGAPQVPDVTESPAGYHIPHMNMQPNAPQGHGPGNYNTHTHTLGFGYRRSVMSMRRSPRLSPGKQDNSKNVATTGPAATTHEWKNKRVKRATPSPAAAAKAEEEADAENMEGDDGPSAYELQRLAKIKENARMMASLGLSGSKGQMRTAVNNDAAERAKSRGLLGPRQLKSYPARSRCALKCSIKARDSVRVFRVEGWPPPTHVQNKVLGVAVCCLCVGVFLCVVQSLAMEALILLAYIQSPKPLTTTNPRESARVRGKTPEGLPMEDPEEAFNRRRAAFASQSAAAATTAVPRSPRISGDVSMAASNASGDGTLRLRQV